MNKIHQHTYHLTAGECDATGSLPLTSLTERLIEVATEHANALGIGYSTLVTRGIGWVLSRLSIEMTEYPGINDTYTITTWIEDLNRHFSERNMHIVNAKGMTIGYARTIWVAIDFKARTMADLSFMESMNLPKADLPCPIAKMPRLISPAAGSHEFDYTFRYCDLDFNRHVNTVRYIDLILNRWNLDKYDHNYIGRFDISFARECHFLETVRVRTDQSSEVSDCELLRDGTKVVSARIKWCRRAKPVTPLKAK
ncbi:MAG: thioesterase [Muribaculaceae bacterium]|nr:thioesterase [Muribaculaceae bacterium]